jgi:hypothetical protein
MAEYRITNLATGATTYLYDVTHGIAMRALRAHGDKTHEEHLLQEVTVVGISPATETRDQDEASFNVSDLFDEEVECRDDVARHMDALRAWMADMDAVTRARVVDEFLDDIIMDAAASISRS